MKDSIRNIWLAIMSFNVIVMLIIVGWAAIEINNNALNNKLLKEDIDKLKRSNIELSYRLDKELSRYSFKQSLKDYKKE